MLSRLEHALNYAAMGIRVFPIIAGTKRPALKEWQREATVDRAMIEAWFGKADHNIGIATGQGVMAIDADTKDGQPGIDSLDMLDLEMLPISFRTRTPSGGTHVLLKTDGPVSNRVKSLLDYPGIDIRGDGGYILGAGSHTEDGPGCVAGDYEIVNDQPIEPMPPEFKQILGERRHKMHKTDDPVVELDLQANVDKATIWLRDFAPLAVEGEGGDQTTYEVAARLRDYGLSPSMAFEVIGEWNDRCEPPWSAEDLETKVENAFQYATGTYGGKTSAADFDAVDIELDIERPSEQEIAEAGAVSPEITRQTEAKKRRSRFQVYSAADSHATALMTAYEPLVEGILNQNTFAVAVGKPGAAKTFNLIDMGVCIAAGKPWAGKYQTTQGVVFYVAAEGGTGIHRRIAAAIKHHNLPTDTPFFVLPATIDLGTSQDDAKAIAKLALDTAKGLNMPLRLTIVDTLARSIGGGDENSAQDMSQFVRNIDTIREATRATVMVVHHTGKDESKGARGSTALLGAIDTEIMINSEGHISTTKQRDLEEIEDVATFRLVDVDIGTDPNGRMLHSAGVEYGATDFDDMPTDEPDGQELFFEVFTELAGKSVAADRGGWVSRAECQTAFNMKRVAVGGEVGEKPLAKTTAVRWLKDFVDKKRIRVNRTTKGALYALPYA